MSCAREGANGVAYSVLREMEKEVVLVDIQPPPSVFLDSTIPMNAGHPTLPSAPSEPQVLKIIKKNEVQVLCAQHNPVRGQVVGEL